MKYYEELYHFGIKGMKWGVRRYQNADGTLTSAGKKRYGDSSRDVDKQYKSLKKAVRRKRAVEAGSANRWMSGRAIGPNSKVRIEQYERDKKAWENTDQYKKAERQWKATSSRLDNAFYSGKIDNETYDKRWEAGVDKYLRDRGSMASNTLWWAKRGGKFMDDYINRGGKELSIAYLKDLGYDNAEAKRIVDRLAKYEYTLGDI